MSDKVEMSLDDIISSNKSKFSVSKSNNEDFKRRPGRSFRGGNNTRPTPRNFSNTRNRNSNVEGQWSHDMYAPGNSEGSFRRQVPSYNSGSGSTKLIVTNLAYTVSDADIKELFSEFGYLKYSAINYDRSGRSLGSAIVEFERRNDALNAIAQYNHIDLDNRPMKITIDDENSFSQNERRFRNNDRPTKPRLGTRNYSKPYSNGFERRGRGGVSRGRGRGGSWNNNRNRNEPTAEELDAELDAYAAQIKK